MGTGTEALSIPLHDLNEGTVEAANFSLERLAGTVGSQRAIDCAEEAILLMPDGGIELDTIQIAAPSAAILPAGHYSVRFLESCSIFLVRHVERHAASHPDIIDPGEGFKRLRPIDQPEIIAVSDWKASDDKPRLKMLQTSFLSINWVEYNGPRDRRVLSPHLHDAFEQGSLAIAGDFVHHLRLPWGPDANQWRSDLHLCAGPDSLVVIPPNIIHTTEGVGDGYHLLIDIFCPPRRDFITNGYVANSVDYEDLQQRSIS
jgi:hypothetical protein